MIYTCNTCCLEFNSSDLQRTHMKCDWHRYNLKRRVAQLPPVSEATFSGKMQQMAPSNTTGAADGSDGNKKPLTKKEQRKKEKEALLEKKRQLLEMARQNMLKAMQAQQQEAEQKGVMTVEDPLPIPVMQPKEDVPDQNNYDDDNQLTPDQLAEKLMAQKIANKVDIPTNVCLFCNHNQRERHLSTFPDMDANIDHMFKCHGFYIPEQKYLVDKEGLIKYMAEKIGLGNVCIVCNYQGKDLQAVRSHMLAKRHCKIPYESTDDKLEISEFYDFSSTYQDYAKKNKVETVVTTTADNGSDDEGDWEDISSAEEEEGDEDEAIPDEYLYNDGMALHLPTGIKIGHRSLQRYYNQVEKPEKILTEGQGTLVAADTRSFVTAFDKQAVQTQQRVWQTEVKDKKRQDKRAAKFINNQPHYRDQLLQ